MSDDLNWDEIQGHVTPGFRSDHQVMLFFRFPDGDVESAQKWVGAMRRYVASSREVRAYNRLFRLIKHRDADARGDDDARTDEQINADVYRFLGAVWVNVAFSFEGLKALGASWCDTFSDVFKDGPYREKGPVADDGPESGARTAHVMLIIAADNPKDLKDEVCEQKKLAHACDLVPVVRYDGDRLPDKKEHFGFRDGVSQPELAESLDGIRRMVSTIAPGEFVFGYRGEDGVSSGFVRHTETPYWVNDGSFLVFLRLKQDVQTFNDALEACPVAHGETPSRCAAKLVGRWPSGAKLGKPLEDEDPTWKGASAAEITLSDFADDRHGDRFPLNSHVRKAFPRDRVAGSPADLWHKVPVAADARQNRLLRRGIPYGKPEDDDRGLLFLAYQTNIASQFEHIAREWIADPDFPRQGSGEDLLLHGLFKPPVEPPPPPEGLAAAPRPQRYVTLTDGGYFFAPSRRALAYLADPTRGWSD